MTLEEGGGTFIDGIVKGERILDTDSVGNGKGRSTYVDGFERGSNNDGMNGKEGVIHDDSLIMSQLC